MKKIFFLKETLLFSILILGSFEGSYASSPVTHLLTSENWHVYQHKDPAGKNIYTLIGYPHKKTGEHAARKDTYIVITAKKNFNVPFFLTFVAGGELSRRSSVLMSFKKGKIKLLPYQDKALTPDAKTEQHLLHHMKDHKELKISSVFKQGQKTEDTYLLAGFKKAYQKFIALVHSKKS